MQKVQANSQRNVELSRASAIFKSGRFLDTETYIKSIIPRHAREPFLHNLLGSALGSQHKWQEAEKSFAKAVKLEPKNFNYLRNLANSQRNNSRLLPAEKTLAKALKINPEFAEGWNSLGLVYLDKKDPDKALSAFNKAFGINQAPEAAANILIETERSNKLDLLEKLLVKFEKSSSEDSVITLCKGLLFDRQKKFSDAHECFSSCSFAPGEKLANEDLELLRVSRHAKVNDHLGRFEDAYNLFTASNLLNIEKASNDHHNPANFHNAISSRHSYFESDEHLNWNNISEIEDAPIFIVGFPRSGTTLLDTFLRGHNDIAVIEEQPLVHGLTHELGTSSKGGIVNLTKLSTNKIEKAATNYLKSLQKFSNEKSIIIDRNPFNLLNIGEIIRIFPKAKFILAIRDPADVVFSCFMQPFSLHGAMSTLSSTESSAETYDELMRLWVLYLEKLNIENLVCHYESLIDDPSASLKEIIDFLGLEWDEKMLDHQKTATSRDRINTSSYAQVVQPIYSSAIKRWENYAEYMPDALKIIAPWREYFGYKK